MRLVNNQADIALTMLNKFCDEVKPRGPWRWQCAVQNGALLPLDASFAGGFLRLTTPQHPGEDCAHALHRAIVRNGTLTGGVKTVFHAVRNEFFLCADLVVIGEQQLLSRLKWALNGFHDGLTASNPARGEDAADHAASIGAPRNGIADLMQDSRWECHPRAEGEYSVALDAKSAPPATVRVGQQGLSIGVELARTGNDALASEYALALYLLSASSHMRLVRALRTGTQTQRIFLLEAQLPHRPEAEEVDHALAALSVAYRQSANEAIALLDEAAARSYLAVRGCSIAPEPNNREEN